MIAARDLGVLAIGAVAAVSGVMAAVELNATSAPPTDRTTETAPLTVETARPAAPSGDLGAVASAIREVLGSFAGAASAPLEQDALAEHVPPSVSQVLTERGAVLVVPTDAEVAP